MEEFFDKAAEKISEQVAHAWFFSACVALVVTWAAAGPMTGWSNTHQLVINTATTIVTFLLVALLQNTQDRSTRAVSHKLDAALEALAEVLDNTDGVDESGATATELRAMIGVEMEATGPP